MVRSVASSIMRREPLPQSHQQWETGSIHITNAYWTRNARRSHRKSMVRGDFYTLLCTDVSRKDNSKWRNYSKCVCMNCKLQLLTDGFMQSNIQLKPPPLPPPLFGNYQDTAYKKTDVLLPTTVWEDNWVPSLSECGVACVLSGVVMVVVESAECERRERRSEGTGWWNWMGKEVS